MKTAVRHQTSCFMRVEVKVRHPVRYFSEVEPKDYFVLELQNSLRFVKLYSCITFYNFLMKKCKDRLYILLLLISVKISLVHLLINTHSRSRFNASFMSFFDEANIAVQFSHLYSTNTSTEILFLFLFYADKRTQCEEL